MIIVSSMEVCEIVSLNIGITNQNSLYKMIFVYLGMGFLFIQLVVPNYLFTENKILSKDYNFLKFVVASHVLHSLDSTMFEKCL